MTEEQRKASSERMKARHAENKAKKESGVAVADPVSISEPDGEDFLQFDEFKHIRDYEDYEYIEFDNTQIVQERDPGALRGLLQAGWVKVAESNVIPGFYLLKIEKSKLAVIRKAAEDRFAANLGTAAPGSTGDQTFTGKVESEGKFTFEDLLKSSAHGGDPSG